MKLDGLLSEHPLLIQGWHPDDSDRFTAAWASAGGLGVLRMPAIPDLDDVRARVRAALAQGSGAIGLDIKGLLRHMREVLAMAQREGVAFLVHGHDLEPEARSALSKCDLPRLALVADEGAAEQAIAEGADALILEGTLIARLARLKARIAQPLLAAVDARTRGWKEALQGGLAGIQLRGPGVLTEGESPFRRLREALDAFRYSRGGRIEPEGPPLPQLRIRHLELPYPIVQGGMGVGVSWDRLAGTVASHGCLGIVSAIGTAYHHPEGVRFVEGRPLGPVNLNHGPALRRILRDARERAGGQGAIGVNILGAIREFDRVVKESVAGGAQAIFSGAGLPLSLPELVGEAEVALVPIISSARALRIICSAWRRRHGRLPDAVVLEGPESGGHQGFSAEQCEDPAFALEALLPQVLEERDRWGDFPVIVAGGIWDHGDIQRVLALGAGGVQMGTRFVGTFECDAARSFKEVLLAARKEDIELMGSPVGMPARGVRTELQRRIQAGTAPPIKCISNCVVPCDQGKGAAKAGYCIADRLSDAQRGKTESGLFFSGSNGWRLKELVSVRELVGELTRDFAFQRLAGAGSRI